MAACFSSLAWEIMWTKEPGRLQSMDRKDLDTTEQLSIHTHTHTHSLGRELVFEEKSKTTVAFFE